MVEFTLHNLDDATLARLSEIASTNHFSLEEQAKAFLVSALDDYSRRKSRYETAKRTAAMTPADSVLLLREDRIR